MSFELTIKFGANLTVNTLGLPSPLLTPIEKAQKLK